MDTPVGHGAANNVAGLNGGFAAARSFSLRVRFCEVEIRIYAIVSQYEHKNKPRDGKLHALCVRCLWILHNAEFSFETNAAPVGGYVDADLLEITAGQDAVTLQTMAWIDDFDDLPMVYEFGYTHGWHQVASVSR